MLMTSSTIVFGAMIGAVAFGVAFLVWRVWGDHEADRQYARIKAGADTDVHDALQGKSFIVGTPSDFIDGGLQGHFTWLSGEVAWGLRLQSSHASLRSLAGTFVPVWIRRGDAESWVRHPDESARVRAYNTDVSLVLPKDLKDGDQIRFGENAAHRGAA